MGRRFGLTKGKGFGMKRYRAWIVHFIADCSECDWYSDDFIDGPKKAADHAKQTGHKISGEKGYACRWNEEKPADDGGSE
jgi:hypothetical protein